MYKIEKQLKIEDFVFPYGKLNPENRWVKMANLIPWDEIEEKYAKQFVNNGNPAKNIRIALGSLIIKQILNCSDRETVEQVKENPYLQYFLGLKEYEDKAPFGASTMTEFRKRFDQEYINELNEMIIKGKKIETKEKDDDTDGDDKNPPNSGTLVIDATCTPANITYPQDIKLLNKGREHLEKIIDEIHDGSYGKKPRTYRKRARKDFLKISKSKSKTSKKLRKAIRKQLGYVFRDIKYIEDYLANGVVLRKRQIRIFEIVKKVYEQQNYMYLNKKKKVDERIVSIEQPHVRPIVRGKVNAKTEFGAKLEISVVNGFARIEKLNWEAYNESESLQNAVEKYKERFGCYPERILADKIYRNRNNINFCKEKNIAISGPALGRPKKDITVDKKQEYTDICDRNIVEGKFGEGKMVYGLDRIFARLKESSETVISLAILALNLNKKLRDLFIKFLQKINFYYKWDLLTVI